MLSANRVEQWDAIWAKEGADGWRASDKALGPVYERIAHLVRGEARLIDLGGGCGDLAALLNARGASVLVLDHSPVAVETARERGIEAEVWTASTAWDPHLDPTTSELVIGYVATEFLEHLEANVRDALLQQICHKPAMLSVPNNRLGPDEEAQHTIKWTAKEFLDYLKQFWADVRVECIGGYLLGVCGVPKSFTMSVCFPARDEEHDIERVLSSFRGAADQLVVGIDPRSQDRTEEIARQYADVVFHLEEPNQGVEGDNNVHFSWIRNQCIERCTGDWIFMTEAHESLQEGTDGLLALDTIGNHIQVCLVARRGLGGRFNSVVHNEGPKTGFHYVQRWMYPWIWRRKNGWMFKRAKHNYLDFPDGTPMLWLPKIVTYHDRHKSNAAQRQAQRKTFNRIDLFHDWINTQSTNSLYYLASEWRNINGQKSIEYFQRLLAMPADNGPRRYQSRLILAKEIMHQTQDWKEAKRVLMGAAMDDWSRIDHWVFLGDLAQSRERYEEAIQYYLYAASRWMDMPLSVWWIDEAFYTWLPCERLAVCYGAIGELEKALHWAKKARESLPVESPESILALHDRNISRIEEKLNDSRVAC